MSETESLAASRTVGWARLGIGFAQGLGAWLLVRRPEAIDPWAFGVLVLVVAYVPLILLAGLGRMRPATLAAWALAATVLLAGLALYDHGRDPLSFAYGGGDHVRRGPSPQLAGFSAIALYVIHHILEPADEERRFPPSYPGLFEGAWRHAFQLVLSIAFTAVFWGVLELGAALFDLIGVKGLRESVLHKGWFAGPATCTAFAAAVHLTDVRPALIRGVRTVALTLFAWLTPLTAALALAFLAALPFTGLHLLWATRFAGALLLSASAVLIFLVNAAYQDGREGEASPPLLRYAGRAAGLILIPLVVLATWACGLRIAQHGLTPERIASLAVLAVAAVYALGYGWAALSRGAWMRPLERVNLVAGVLAALLILLLFSPVADPASLSVADQLGRLKSGRTAPEAFDYGFLRFRSASFGRDALARLAKSPNARIAERARRALTWNNPYEATGQQALAAPPFSHAKVYPTAEALPQSFRRQTWSRAPAGLSGSTDCFTGGGVCTLYVHDLDGDGRPEVMVDSFQLTVFALGPDGAWADVGTYANASCVGVKAGLEAGDIARAHPPRLPDLQVRGQVLPFLATSDCAVKPPAPPTKPSPPQTPMLSPAFIRP